ncbi:hypothetical protein [Streptomyces sp. NBC_00080]|uniref:hypothetical protein n=1 Tax=Streptomyces sp. NBC_00080 TaxID=2975645 RepID=UPI00386A146A
MPPSFTHRITKYDPADRDEHGHYTGAEEAVSDHGPVEAAYLAAIAAFAEDSGIDRLEIREPAERSRLQIGDLPGLRSVRFSDLPRRCLVRIGDLARRRGASSPRGRTD